MVDGDRSSVKAQGRREGRNRKRLAADFEARGLQRTCTCYVVSCRYPDPVKVM